MGQDINVKIDPTTAHIDRETLEKSLSIAVKVLNAVAMLSNNDWVKKIALTCEQILTKPWFVDLFMEILELLNKNAPAEEINKVFSKFERT